MRLLFKSWKIWSSEAILCLFGDNTLIEPLIYILYFSTTWLLYEYCLLYEY